MSSAENKRGVLFIAGTGVGVGKTKVGCAVLRGLAKLGRKVVGMKPIETGCGYNERHDLVGRDGDALRAACNVEIPPLLVSPYRIAPHLAPALALSQAGLSLEMDDLRGQVAALVPYADTIVIEGPWGALTPLADDGVTLDLAERVGATVLIVGPDQRDTPGHVLGVLEACRRRALNIAGVVLSKLGPGSVTPENERLIRTFGGVEVFETIAYGENDVELDLGGVSERLVLAMDRP